jgi:N-acetylglucosamine kinase-like BadF-type ATPase
MQTILGIDGGGTKTTFLMVDEDGHELARVETGPSNYIAVGRDQSRQAIADGIHQLPGTPDVVSAGFAGAGKPECIQHYRDIFAGLLPNAKVITETDVHMAYFGALGNEPGVVLMVGTGSIIMGRKRDGTLFRYGGWRPHFGDEGSGFWIGREATRTALAFEEDHRHSDFPPYVATLLGLNRIEGVIPAWTAGKVGAPQIAALAQALIARFSDEPGAGILKAAGAHIRNLVERGTIRIGEQPVRVVAMGSIASQPVIPGLIGMRFETASASPEQGAIAWARQHLARASGAAPG